MWNWDWKKKRAGVREVIPGYVDDLIATQKITQYNANAIANYIKTHLSELGAVVQASRKLIFQPKKVPKTVKGKLVFGEMDNKNKQPDVAHIRFLSEYIKQLKAIAEVEMKAYTECTRKIALKTKKNGAYKKKGSGTNSPVVIDKAKFSDAEEDELADLKTRTSSFPKMAQHIAEESQRNIEKAAHFLKELMPLIHKNAK